MIKTGELFSNLSLIRKYIESLLNVNGVLVLARHRKSLAAHDVIAEEIESVMQKYHLSMYVVKHIIMNDIDEFSLECVICGKPLDLSKRYTQACKGDCATKLGHIKSEKTCLERYGVPHITQTEMMRKISSHPRSEETNRKIKQTNMERYGCENVFQSKKIREKIVETSLQRYGVSNPGDSAEALAKRRKTNIERYGTPGAAKSEEAKKRMRESSLEKYGTEHPSQSAIVKEKIRQTSLERYGTEHPMQTEEVKEKLRQATQKRLGVDNPFQSEEVKDRIKQTCLERYGTLYASQSKEFKLTRQINHRRKRFSNFCKMLTGRKIEMLTSYEDHLSADLITFKCKVCDAIFEAKYASSDPCLIWCPTCHKSHSNVEEQIYQFLKNLIGADKIKRNVKSILADQYELDIYLPENKIAIEVDGIYWHSDRYKDSRYHLRKTEECLDRGIELIHILQNEWEYKSDIVKSIIKAKLGMYDQVIYARKCSVVEITDETYKNFLENNHLQGYASARIRLGLMYEDELVAILGIGTSRFKREEIELIRFCTKINTKVIGGLSRLIKHSEVNDIVSYADRRYFNGSGYEKIGFKFVCKTEPGYMYCNDHVVLNRFQCQKHRLRKLLGDKFDPNLTEGENMANAGYYRIYDCGMLKFRLII